MTTVRHTSVADVAAGEPAYLGKYVLDARLGAGGMAEVFRAHTVGAEGFERPVAIKRVLPDASKHPAFSTMFIAEAKLSSRMQHPNIVGVLDFDRGDDGRLYLVMELVEGRDLDGLLETGRLPWPVAIYVIVEVLRGLGYAHDLPAGADGVRGLIHRDVSPHNVLVGWNGAVKVSDFGIAKARAATAASASVVIKGKPAYMSPEQINGAPLDGRSDLFAVGVMLWQMATGQHLFAAATTAETLARVLFAPVPGPRSVAADVPPDLESVIMRLLARDPAHRFQTSEDAIDDLLRCRDAPRDGRRDLERLLAERFPQQAPFRTGQRRRWATTGSPGGLAAGTPPHAIIDGAGGAGIDALMRATTRTVAGHPGARRASATRRAGMFAIALVAAVTAVTALVVASGGDGRAAVHPDRVDAALAPSSSAPALDAGLGAAVDAAVVPTDAAFPTGGATVPIAPRPGLHREGKSAGSSPIHDVAVPTDFENGTRGRSNR